MAWRGLRRWALWPRLLGTGALLALALVLALTIWFLIVDAQSADEERFGFGLGVDVINVPSGLATATRVPTAVITIAGRPSDLERATPEDFVATLDLAGLPAGMHAVPLRVRTLDGDVRVRSVTPESVEIVLEPVVRQVRPVEVRVAVPPPTGFEVGEFVVQPQTVTVSGVQEIVQLVHRVVVPVDAAGATVDLDLAVPPQAQTAGGQAISGVRIDPPLVTVRVPITQETFRRSVVIVPDIRGQPAAGFRVAAVTTEPFAVVAVGTLVALAGAEASTAPVSIRNASDDVEATVAVTLAVGLTAEGQQRARVRVDIEPVTAEATYQLPVEVVGLTNGLEAVVTPAEVEVRVSGPAPVIAALTGAALRITVLAQERRPGVYVLPVRVGFVRGVSIQAVSPSDVEVVIAEGGGQEPADGTTPEPAS